MSEIKPWAPPAGYVPPKDGLARMSAEGKHYILVPDDGSHVVVTAKEWAQMRPWLSKLSDCLEHDEVLGKGHVLGLLNDLDCIFHEVELGEDDDEVRERIKRQVRSFILGEPTKGGER